MNSSAFRGYRRKPRSAALTSLVPVVAVNGLMLTVTARSVIISSNAEALTESVTLQSKSAASIIKQSVKQEDGTRKQMQGFTDENRTLPGMVVFWCRRRGVPVQQQWQFCFLAQRHAGDGWLL